MLVTAGIHSFGIEATHYSTDIYPRSWSSALEKEPQGFDDARPASVRVM